MIKIFVFFYLIVISVIKTSSFQIKFIKRYSELKYDSNNLRDIHNRVKRSLDNHISIEFFGLERKFSLNIKPSNKNYFETDFIDFGDEKNKKLEKLINYEGRLNDELDSSYVFGYIHDGIFIGTIITNDGKYFVEPTKRYSNNASFHSIIYHEKDIVLNKDLTETKNSINNLSKKSVDEEILADEEKEKLITCGLSDETIKNKVEIEQNKLSDKSTHQNEDMMYKYTKEANSKFSSRTKRQVTQVQLPFPNSNSVCGLYLIADPFYYLQIFNNEGQKDSTITLAYIRNNFNTYVATLNSVFNSVKFFVSSNNSNYYSGVQFKIYKTKVITFDQCNSPSSTLTAAESKLCQSNLDVFTFLSYSALQNYNSYCLAYTFTARDFSNGALGLAYLATTNGDPGGICSKNIEIQAVNKSLNTGVVTIINYGSRVVDRLSQITFLHEVGHSFGANHDPSACQPGDSKGGNYIMYFSSTSGTQPNNKVFSSCSLTTMGTTLNYVVNNNNFCFQSSNASICGNGIVENNEQCDCGASPCQDKCCDSNCRLTPGSSCSPSQGSCCESDCSFSQPNKICSQNSDCKSSNLCTGNNAICPPSSSISPNLTACNGGTQVCLSGECIGSICLRYNLQQCYLTGDLSNPSTDKFALCHLACIGAATNNTCTDSFNIPAIIADINTGIVMKPGSVCSDNRGYCDTLSKCRVVNLNTLTTKLLTLFLTPAMTVQDVKIWVQNNWWAVLIFVIIFLVLFNFVIFLLSKCLPTSNPNINLKDQSKKKKENDDQPYIKQGSEFRRKSQIFTTEISDNVDYERPIPKKKNSKQRILI